jgi:hypothetical protein
MHVVLIHAHFMSSVAKMKNAKQQGLRNWGQGGPNQILVGKEAKPSSSKGLELHHAPT